MEAMPYTKKPQLELVKQEHFCKFFELKIVELGIGGMRVYLHILMATLIFNDMWYPEQVSKRIF